MNDAKATIRDILMGDDIIRDLLPNNKVFYKMGEVKPDGKFPALMFQDGPIVNLEHFSFRQDIYVRVYDEPQNGTIYINKIGNRMRKLLHLQQFTIEDDVMVECRLNNTLGELEDQTIGKNFVEYQFRITTI